MSDRRRAQLGNASWAARSLAAVAVVISATASCASNVPAQSTDFQIGAAAPLGARSVPVDRLTLTVTYQSGQERFDPLPPTYQPKITTRQALEAFAKSVDPHALGTDEKPTVLLASYTNFVTGKHATFVTGTMDPVAAARSDEASKPSWTAVPVWYIRYLHVPVAPAGVPAAPGRTRVPPQVVVQEMVIPVSAETGQILMMENVSADPTAASWPTPTSGDGRTDKPSPVNAQPATPPPPTATRTQ